MSLRLDKAKSVNTDSSSSIYSKNNDSTSEPSKKYYFLSPLRIFIVGSEAKYDF